MKTKLTSTLLVIAIITIGNLQKVNAQNWLTTGNGGLSTSNFLGTKDTKPIIFKTNNVERGRLQSGGSWRFGTSTNFANIDTVGKLTFGGTGTYQVAGNHYVFQYSANPSYGLYFNSTIPQYEFRNGSASPIFYVNANNGNGIFKGNLKIGSYTLPSTDGASGQVLKTNGTGTLSWSNDNGASYTAGSGISISGNVISNTGDLNGADDANLSLSNLSSTAINQSLLPLNTNAIDLGSSSQRWRDGYFSGKIGINTDPSYPIDINNTSSLYGIRVVNTSTSHAIGIYSSSVNQDGLGIGTLAEGGSVGTLSRGYGGVSTGDVYGVFGQGIGTAGVRIGVKGYAYNSTTESSAANYYGIFGSADNGGTFSAAGYFEGSVYAVKYNTISDRKFKTGITPLKNSLDQLMKLNPSTYEFRTAEYAKMGLPKGKQMGLIADEVKQIFPQLVEQAVQPAHYDKDNKTVISPEIKYEAVNYQGFIPVLIASIQEQQKQIEELKLMVEKLSYSKPETSTNAVAKSAQTNLTVSNAKLEQNSPNPFTTNTSIRYNLPIGFKAAQIIITNNNGKAIKQIQLNTAVNGMVNIDASTLTSGTYNYTLVVDGKAIESKKMIVAH